jgi:hypothetical protein
MSNKRALIVKLSKIIRQMLTEIRWKPGSAARHLLKRKLRGYLPDNANMADYEKIIRTILETPTATVYLYWRQDVAYPGVAADFNGQQWLVMFSFDGMMESAFVIENPQIYLSPPQFERVGLLEEVLDERR